MNGSEGIVVLVSVVMYALDFYFNENITIRAGYKSFLLVKIEIVRSDRFFRFARKINIGIF